MIDDQAVGVINAALGAGGMGIVVLAGMKWFVGDYFKKAKENRELEKKLVESQVQDIRKVSGEIKMEVLAMKDRIYHTEKTMIEAVARLNNHSDKFVALSEAMKGFVKAANDRMNVIESKTDKVIVAVGSMTRIRGGKVGSGEGA